LTEEGVFGFCEAISHFLYFSVQSKASPFARKKKLAASEEKERTKVKTANVRRYMLVRMLSIWRQPMESLSGGI